MIRAKDEYRNSRLTIGAQVMALFALFACADAAAPTPEHSFSGRWRMDTKSIKGNIKPTIIQLFAGGFKKDGSEILKADGYFHQVSSDEYVDEISISIENDRIVKEVDKIHGELAYTVEYVVSPDGNTLTWHVTSYTNPNGQAVKSETVQRRVGWAAKGTHLISGKWERVSVTVDSRSDWILRLDGNNFSWRTEAGTGYDAIVGGKSVKIDGDASGARALITRPRPDIVVETDLSAQGKRAAVLSMQLMSDKKTIRSTAFSFGEKKSTTFYLNKIAE